MPKFSILIPIIKGKFLATAIKSVLRQSFSDWEMILYNDCSPDDIESVTKKYRDDRIRYYQGKNNLGAKDPSKTWNKLLTLANGQYVCLLGDDDYFSENYFEEINKLILKYPAIDLFRARIKRVDEKNEIISSGRILPKHETWEQSMYQRNVKKGLQSTCEFVLKKNALLKVGGYPNFPRACGSDDAAHLLLAKKNGITSTNKAIGYWRKSSLNISDNDSEKMNKYKIKFYLIWVRDFLNSIFSSKVPVHELYQSIEIERHLIKNKLDSAKLELDSAKLELDSAKLELDSTRTELSSYKTLLNSILVELNSKMIELDLTKAELKKVYSSREWKAGTNVIRIAKKIAPNESYRRKAIIGAWRTTKNTVELIKKIDKLSKYLKPKKRRKINLKSKKIIVIDHSYHKKTKSNVTLDYLKQFFDVQIIFDDSWRGKPFVDLSFIDESYLGVIFWQSLPDPETIKKIKNENIIYFPMCDQSGRLELGYWENYRYLKFINFSKALHEKLKNWGFESMYIQYFPEPNKFFPGKKDEAFFWQRLSFINIKTILPMFKQGKVKIHLHRAIDPGQEFIEPSKQEEKEFQITYSDWFGKKEEMWDLIKQKGIYVAPREYEGIGLSFLEAMAMGKAVVAVDNPTMNEYIEHNKTGYLFQLSNPKKINMSNMELVQKNTYKFMRKGYERWQKEKRGIIDFIKSE